MQWHSPRARVGLVVFLLAGVLMDPAALHARGPAPEPSQSPNATGDKRPQSRLAGLLSGRRPELAPAPGGGRTAAWLRPWRLIRRPDLRATVRSLKRLQRMTLISALSHWMELKARITGKAIEPPKPPTEGRFFRLNLLAAATFPSRWMLQQGKGPLAYWIGKNLIFDNLKMIPILSLGLSPALVAAAILLSGPVMDNGFTLGVALRYHQRLKRESGNPEHGLKDTLRVLLGDYDTYVRELRAQHHRDQRVAHRLAVRRAGQRAAHPAAASSPHAGDPRPEARE